MKTARRLSAALGGALLAATLAHAGDRDLPANETSKFLGVSGSTREAVAVARIRFVGAHPFFGGPNVFLEGSGRCAIEVFPEKGSTTQRFLFDIGPERAAAIFEHAMNDDLLATRPSSRLGVPDEVGPVIELENPSGERRAAAKWAGETVPSFDRVYLELRALAAESGKRKPDGTGSRDARDAWAPFEDVVVTLGVFSGRPDPVFRLRSKADGDELRKRLAGLPAGKAPDEGGLGYHGFRLKILGGEGLPLSLRVFNGRIELVDRAGKESYLEDTHGLEGWLLEQARARKIDAAEMVQLGK